tara:strand:- start:840 stop:2294 length:1455 start_codon:yes stop_codon:yes gene_type:complete
MALVNFNKPGQRLPAAAVGPAYQAGLTDINEFSRDQDMVDALLKRGSSTAPVQSAREGAYRALQGVLGGYMKGRDKRELQSQKDNFRKTMAEALIAGRGTPGTEETIPQSVVTPTDTRLGVTDPDMLQTELPPPPQQSILDDPSVPDVASLGLERIETPTGPGGQVIQKEYISRTPGTPGGIQPMLDVLRGAGTREADQAAIELEFGGMQQQAALEAQAVERKAARDDYLFQQKNKAFTPQALVPGRDVPYSEDVAVQLGEIAAARRPPPERFQEVSPGVQQSSETGEIISAPLTREQQREQEREEARPTDVGALQSLSRQTKTVVNNIDLALELVGPTTTGWGAAISILPNTDARKLRNYLTTIRANIGFDTLREMREASKTGGALGNVSEQENVLLQAVKGALDQSQADQLVSNLNKIKELYPIVLAEKEAAFKLRYREPYNSLDIAVELTGNEDEAEAQYQALSPGQSYIDTDGTQRRKSN